MREEGFASPLLVALLALAGLLCLATADAANVLLARARAQAAADAAALAAAAAQWPSRDDGASPEQAAREMAELNDSALVSCDCPMRGESASVTVRKVTRVRLLGVAPPNVTARAEARVDVARIFDPRR